MYNTLQSGVASAERVFDFLDEPEEVPDAAVALSPVGETARGRVEFRNVRFGYTPGTPVIEDLSLVRPTQLNFVPRIWDMLHQEYLAELDRTDGDPADVLVLHPGWPRGPGRSQERRACALRHRGHRAGG